ncbi:RHS repeat domain-containing protein, partial [Lysinibacillus fusiformis]
GHYSIISDYLGTPVEAYDEQGNKVWSAELDVYGRVKEFTGEKDFIPFRYQGQYEDIEIGLYYNRFRYYDPEQGNYTQVDPIGLAGGNPTLYGYTRNPLSEIDPLGLIVVYRNLRPDEKISNGLTAKNPGRGMKPSGHVMNGSSPNFKGSQFISTTTDIDVARKWNKEGQTIVKFDTDDVVKDSAGNKNIIDVSTPEKAKAEGFKGRPDNYAVSSKEVLVEGHVPTNKITKVCK